ncbi:hypothetical protein ACFLTH_16515, partial [Bacteroidota bacterium]
HFKYILMRIKSFQIPNLFSNKHRNDLMVFYYLFMSFGKNSIEKKYVEKAEKYLSRTVLKKSHSSDINKKIVWIYNHLLGIHFYRGIKRI